MFDKLAAVETRYNELNEQMAQPDVATDHRRMQQIAREQRELEEVVTTFRVYREVERQIDDAQALLDDGADPELRELAQDELEQLGRRREALDERMPRRR